MKVLKSCVLLVILAVIVSIVSSVIINHNRLRFLAVAADEDSLVVAEGSGKMILFHRMDLKTGSVNTRLSASASGQLHEKVQLDSLTHSEAEVSWVFPSGNTDSFKIQLKKVGRVAEPSITSDSFYTIQGNRVVSYRPEKDGTMKYSGWCGIGKFSHLVDIARTGPYMFAADKGGIFSKGGIYGIGPGDPYWRRIAVF